MTGQGEASGSEQTTSTNLDDKLRLLQLQKCRESLKQNNQAGVYGLLSSARDLVVDFLLRRVIFPFDFFSSSRSRFPFETARQETLMRRSMSALFGAASSVHSNSNGGTSPLRFVRVDLDKLGLRLAQWKLPTPTRMSRPSLELDQEPQRMGLSKVIALVPKFAKQEGDLSLQKMKEFRSGGPASVQWLDYDPRFELRPSSANFSLTPFDAIVHDFGLQSHIVRGLTEFLLKYSNSLRVSGDSLTRPSFEISSQLSNSDKTRLDGRCLGSD